MPSERKFSRITVTSDADDDVVIQAGAYPRETPEEASGEAARKRVARAADDVSTADGGGGADAEALEPRVSPGASEGGAGTAGASVGSSDPAHGKDAYRETTLADLEGAKMPTMQKAIIAVAVLLVLAFAVYQLL